VFIKNIARILEGLIYILLGVVAATIVITFFTSLPANALVKKVKEIIEASLVVILILLPVPTILNKYVNSPNGNGLKQFLSKIVYGLKNMHIALGSLFIGLRILHVRINPLFESVTWNMETATSILLFIFLVPTVIYGILRINNTLKYRKPHRFFLVLTYLMFIVHLFH
jgi:hypothetical protein